MLARLDEIPGVASARSDSSGRFFWIELAPGVRENDVSARVRETLGASASILSPDASRAQLAARERGDPWLRASEVMTLSFLEGRLLSVRIAGDASREAGATPGEREALAEAIRVELFATLERVHREGGRRSGGWIDEEWPAVAAAAAARCAPELGAEVLQRVAASLPDLLRGRVPGSARSTPAPSPAGPASPTARGR